MFKSLLFGNDATHRSDGVTDVIAELKWLKESGNRNGLEGDTLWFKIIGKF